MFSLFEQSSAATSQLITRSYSTSFSLGIRTLHSRYREPIYGIYGFVRLADEIVDSFHQFDKASLLAEFKADTYKAIERGVSLNPVLYSFQKVVKEYGIPRHLIEAFFHSMEMDLNQTAHGRSSYDEYIYGSAEVVGLMCLLVFANGDVQQYEALKQPAKALGAAFQKVNFLRDMKSDFDERGRVYFPGVDFAHFKEDAKARIEAEVEEDFRQAYIGIQQLPMGARSGVLLAYRYYLQLFRRIRRTPAKKLMQARIRVPDLQKLSMYVQLLLQNSVRNMATAMF